MSDKVADTWLVGVVANGEALSGVRVHAGYVAAGPAANLPHRLQVRLRYLHGEASGFPDATESEELLQQETSLVEALGERAILVAVLTVPGFRDLMLHTAESDGCVDIVTRQGLDEVDVVDDPAWSAYRALFADAVPADGDRRRIEDAARTTGEGAPLCRVQHHFGFPTLAEADQAAAALRNAGLMVTFVPSDDVADAAPPSFTVTENEALTQVEMARSRDVLAGFATGWGGQYQGWEIIDATSAG